MVYAAESAENLLNVCRGLDHEGETGSPRELGYVS